MSSSLNIQNCRDLNQCILHLWYKFGDPDFNRWWVIRLTSSKWDKFWLWSKICELEGQGQSSPKTIGTLTKVFYTYGPNFVIPACMGPRVIAWTRKWLIHTWTHRQTQATTIPEGQNWLEVKILHRSGMIDNLETFTWHLTASGPRSQIHFDGINSRLQNPHCWHIADTAVLHQDIDMWVSRPSGTTIDSKFASLYAQQQSWVQL